MDPIYVTGHRNPDTDSIVAALAYAALRNACGVREYVAACLGHVSDETQSVLNRFGFAPPKRIHSMHTQVRDLEFDTPPLLGTSVTVRRGWTILEKQKNISAVPVANEDGTLTYTYTLRDGLTWSDGKPVTAKDLAFISTVTEVTDISDIQETLATRADHETVTNEVGDLLRQQGVEPYILSTEACAECERCAYLDGQPCRFPERMHPCVESHGINVIPVLENNGIEFQFGANVVTWISLLFY